VTYRIRGHYVGDPEKTYRTPEEVEVWKLREPLKLAREKLLDGGVDAAELEALDLAVNQRLDAVLAWAVEQPFPTLEQAIDHVYIPLADGEPACH
jgi:TPP-dependent pyruvate/acetoin dehydrogenase alpha subunit